jgi:hypothetical protein
MNSESVFELTQLAEASYAKLEGYVDREKLIDQLQNADDKMTFSRTQAIKLADTWSVITHRPNTESGYSSTLFKNVDGSYVLAFRGTETGSLSDIYSDLLTADILGIVTDGLAMDQIVDLYNEWQRISQESYHAAYLETLAAETEGYVLAKAGRYVTSFNMTADAYLDYLRSRPDIVIDEPLGVVETVRFSDSVSTGLGLAADIAANGLTVTGHSLGGHLAMAFTRLFPSIGVEALTINGAGYPTGSTPGLGGMALSNIANLYRERGPSPLVSMARKSTQAISESFPL